MKAAYKHTNIVARDWQKLAAFYEKVFGCEPVPPERRLSGEIAAAEVEGVGSLTFVYLADPEGNIIELQAWSQ